MDTLTYSELWVSIPAEARLRACLAFWQSAEVSERARADVLPMLAKSLRFREKFLKTQSAAKRAEWLLRQSSHPDFRRFHGELLGALLVTEHANMIEEFLDVQGIPRRGCFLEGETTPSAESLCKGIRAIRKTCGDWSTSLYLGFTLAQGEDPQWAALPAAIATEGLDIRQTLLAPIPPA